MDFAFVVAALENSFATCAAHLFRSGGILQQIFDRVGERPGVARRN
jgi:hypothetical protein